MLVGETGEGDPIVRSGDVGWWWNVVSETTVLVKVDDEEADR